MAQGRGLLINDQESYELSASARRVILVDDSGSVSSVMKGYPSNTTSQSVTVSSGSGSHTTTVTFSNEIKAVIVKPVNESDTYYFGINEATTGLQVLESRRRSGSWTYLTPFPAVDALELNITSAVSDGTFEIKLIYI